MTPIDRFSDYDFQKYMLEILVYDPGTFALVREIFNPENFEPRLQTVAKFMVEYAEKYNIVPPPEQVEIATRIKLNTPTQESLDKIDWFIDDFETFTRNMEVQAAVIKAVEYMDSNQVEKILPTVKHAVEISLTRDLGTNYFENPKERTLSMINNNQQTGTGWKTFDEITYGGFSKGELQIFCAPSGGGKSLFLQNLAVNWFQKKLNGVYITLELNEAFCAQRIDSMVTGYKSKEIFKHLDDVELKIKMLQKTSGNLQIKYMPANVTNVNNIRSYLKELQIKTGIPVDFVCVDYLDLLSPATAKVNPSDVFTKDKFVSEELRNLAAELNVLLVTASQLNRSAIEEVEFDHSMISGGISKIMTADNVIGIYTSIAMRERGKYQLQLLKTRTSAGVGKKVDLDFDVDSMRITDEGDSSQGPTSGAGHSRSGSNILKSIKAKSIVNESPDSKFKDEEDDVDPGNIRLNKLSKMLNKKK